MGINFSNKVRASIRQTRGYSILNTINDGNEESEDYRSLVPIAEMTTGVVYEDTVDPTFFLVFCLLFFPLSSTTCLKGCVKNLG